MANIAIYFMTRLFLVK